MKITNGIHRVGSDLVTRYLIIDTDGVTVIDAGLPGYWTLLQAELATVDKSLSDVRALILTHGDTDHIGFAARLNHQTGIAAHVHPADGDRARLKSKKPNAGWSIRRLAERDHANIASWHVLPDVPGHDIAHTHPEVLAAGIHAFFAPLT